MVSRWSWSASWKYFQRVVKKPRHAVLLVIEIGCVSAGVRWGDALVHGIVIKNDWSFGDRVVNVLCRVRYDRGLVVVEPGVARNHIRRGMMKIDMHKGNCLLVFRI